MTALNEIAKTKKSSRPLITLTKDAYAALFATTARLIALTTASLAIASDALGLTTATDAKYLPTLVVGAAALVELLVAAVPMSIASVPPPIL